jgi:hypothetical protein
MTSRSFLPLLSTAALLAVGAPSANAQANAAQTGPSSGAAAAPAYDKWEAHPTGKYLLELTLPEGIKGVNLTISDSAGTPTALFWPVGDHDGHVMTVTVKDTDLVLEADAPRGKVIVTIERQGERLTGRWSMGMQGGPLTGKVEGAAKPS